jgi:hypothetical protein
MDLSLEQVRGQISHIEPQPVGGSREKREAAPNLRATE